MGHVKNGMIGIYNHDPEVLKALKNHLGPGFVADGEEVSPSAPTAWDFTSALNPPGDSVNVENIEHEVPTVHPTRDLDAPLEKPVIYHPDTRTLYVGSEGGYHSDLENHIRPLVLQPGQSTWPALQFREGMGYGRLSPAHEKTNQYTGETESNPTEIKWMVEPQDSREIAQTIGAKDPMAQWAQWNFTSSFAPIPVFETKEPNHEYEDMLPGRYPIIYRENPQRSIGVPGANQVTPAEDTLYIGKPGQTHGEVESELGLLHGGVHRQGVLRTHPEDPSKNFFHWFGMPNASLPPAHQEIMQALRERHGDFKDFATDSNGAWDFVSSRSPLKVVERTPEPRGNNPIIYHRPSQTVFMAENGGAHENLIHDYDLPYSTDDETAWHGRLWTALHPHERTAIEWYGAEPPEAKEIHSLLGADPPYEDSRWNFTATQVVPINHPGSRGHGEGEPVIHDPETDTVYVGPQGSYHWDMYPHMPNIDPMDLEGHNKVLESPTEAFEGLNNGRIEGDHVDWYKWPHNFEEVNNALGVQPKTAWDFTSKTSGLPQVIPVAEQAPEDWHEKWTTGRRPVYYHVPSEKVYVGPENGTHAALYEQHDHDYEHEPRMWTPEAGDQEEYHGHILNNKLQWWEDNQTRYPGEASAALMMHMPSLDMEPPKEEDGWDFTASGLNVPPDPSLCVDCGGLGCPLCEYTGQNQIGPMQQTPEELPTHGPVQIGNEEPGVATIGA